MVILHNSGESDEYSASGLAIEGSLELKFLSSLFFFIYIFWTLKHLYCKGNFSSQILFNFFFLFWHLDICIILCFALDHRSNINNFFFLVFCCNLGHENCSWKFPFWGAFSWLDLMISYSWILVSLFSLLIYPILFFCRIQSLMNVVPLLSPVLSQAHLETCLDQLRRLALPTCDYYYSFIS